jgi:hypothetical protein
MIKSRGLIPRKIAYSLVLSLDHSNVTYLSSSLQFTEFVRLVISGMIIWLMSSVWDFYNTMPTLMHKLMILMHMWISTTKCVK